MQRVFSESILYYILDNIEIKAGFLTIEERIKLDPCTIITSSRSFRKHIMSGYAGKKAISDIKYLR